MELGIASSTVRRLAATLATGRVGADRTLATFTIALGAIRILLGAVVWVLAAPLSRWLGFAAVLGEIDGVELVRWCAVWIAIVLLTLPEFGVPVGSLLAAHGIAARFAWLTAVVVIASAPAARP